MKAALLVIMAFLICLVGMAFLKVKGGQLDHWVEGHAVGVAWTVVVLASVGIVVLISKRQW